LARLGRHQAFGLIANRCSAADAECLKAIRDGGEYKQLGLTWDAFCEKHAGVSRVQANRQIHYLEEFGANYFRLSEVMAISPDTYRLIAGAVTEEGIECDGQRVALTPENRGKVAAAGRRSGRRPNLRTRTTRLSTHCVRSWTSSWPARPSPARPGGGWS
jgi:hypothetical protein